MKKKFKDNAIRFLTTALVLIAAVFLGKFVFMLLEWIFGLFSKLFGAVATFALKNLWQMLVCIILFSLIYSYSDQIVSFFRERFGGKVVKKQRTFKAKKYKDDEDDEEYDEED